MVLNLKERVEDLPHQRHRIVPCRTDPTDIHDPTVAGRIEAETRARHTARRGVIAVSREREKDARYGRLGIFFIHCRAETEGGVLVVMLHCGDCAGRRPVCFTCRLSRYVVVQSAGLIYATWGEWHLGQ